MAATSGVLRTMPFLGRWLFATMWVCISLRTVFADSGSSGSGAFKIAGIRIRDENAEDGTHHHHHKQQQQALGSGMTSSSSWSNLMQGIETYDKEELQREEEEENTDVLESIKESDFLLFDLAAAATAASMSFSSDPPSDQTTASPTTSNAPSITPRPSPVPTIGPATKGPTLSPLSIPLPPFPSPSSPNPPSSRPSPSPSFSHAPSLSPTASSKPSVSPAPSHSPTLSSPPSVDSPTASPSPTRSPPPAAIVPVVDPSPAPVVYTCTERGVEVASPPYENLRDVSINVGFLVESLFFVSDYLSELELKIMEDSLISALQCGENQDGDGLFSGPGTTLPRIPVVTSFTGDECRSLVSICTTLETRFEFTMDLDLNPESAEFLSYVALQKNMNGGIYSSEIPEVDRMEYLSPLPLLPLFPDPLEASDSEMSVSPYTMGAVAAVSVGGLMALWAWSRNRRTRNNRHMALIDSD